MKYKVNIGPLKTIIEPADSNELFEREIFLEANIEANSPEDAANKAAAGLSVAIEGFQMKESKPSGDMIPRTPLGLMRFR